MRKERAPGTDEAAGGSGAARDRRLARLVKPGGVDVGRAVAGGAAVAACLGVLWVPPAAWAGGGENGWEVAGSREQDWEGRRVALVVGNDAYKGLRRLENAVLDAKTVAAALKRAGFDVLPVVANATRRELGLALVNFVSDLRPGDMALFYFAGHGVRVDDRNYLVSTDHAGVSEAEVRLNELSVRPLAEEMRRRAGVAILIFDACRNNPFPGRGTTRGLEEPRDVPEDAFIVFAAGAGQTSDDGEPGKGGVFSREFVRAVGVPGIVAEELFRDVAKRVAAASGERQRPVYKHNVLVPLVLHPEGMTSETGVFRDCVDCPEMVAVPAGRFVVGIGERGNGPSDEGEPGGTAVRRFALSKYEVTFEEYERFVAATGGRHQPPSDGGWGRGRRPVINVSWDDAAAYARWLAEMTGEEYRLPSEREWEYAARAGTTTRYSWGAGVGGGAANCSDCGDDWEQETAPVGEFRSNAWGLHDMAGNVWEWVADCWRREGRVAGRGSGDGAGRGECGARVARGGSWMNGAVRIGPAARTGVRAGDRHRAYGFRVARSLGTDGEGVSREQR